MKLSDCLKGCKPAIFVFLDKARGLSMATIHLVEGPVGAGKSTYSYQLMLEHSAAHLDLDEWMVNLFSKDRPANDFMEWYLERKDRCLVQILSVAQAIVLTGSDVVLELGLVRAADRQDFYEKLDLIDSELKVYLLSAPLETRRLRVLKRNQDKSSTFKMAVTQEVFELANRAWEAPTEDEISKRNVIVL